MRKHLLLLVGLLTVTTVTNAQKVSEEQALQKAQQFMQGKSFTSSANKTRRIKSATQTTPSRNFYVFNVEDNGGFVIVSGDERTAEILGYSENGNLDMTTVPSNVKWWMEYYDQAIANLENQPQTSAAKVRRVTAARDEISPMISTQWSQYAPFNEQCPLKGEENCVTGCVATAMGQLMNYWKWPETTAPVAEYTTWRNGIQMPALEATTFDWNNMSNDDYARLMKYCGQAVQMDYGTEDDGGSGAADGTMAGAFINTFGFDSGCHIVYRNGYNREDWEDIIYNELKNGRPVIYGGTTDQGFGHAFICHGYKDYMYYIDWGWGGYCDGYFIMSLMDAEALDGHGFIYNQDAVIGIQKPTGNTTDYKLMTITKLGLTSETQVTRNSASEDFNGVGLEWQMSPSLPETTPLSIGFALYRNNTLEKILGGGNVNMPYDQYISNSGPFSVNFGAGLTDGNYQIKAVYRKSGASTWELAEGSDYRYIDVVISGNTLTMTTYPTNAVDETDEVIVTAKSYTRTYGDANPTFEYETKGATLKGTPEITCEATATSPIGTYPIVATQGSVTNTYSNYLNGTLTITKAPLTIGGGTYTIKQGEALPTFAAEYTGFKNNETEDVLTAKPTLTTTATSASEPGTYDVLVSGAAADNYSITYAKGVLTITEADPITLTAKSYTRTYGDENPVFDFDAEGAELKGIPTVTCEATAASPAGVYPIVISKGSVENYNDTYVNGTLTITKATLTVKAEDKVYEQSDAAVAPTLTMLYEGFRNGDTEESLDEKPTISCAAADLSTLGEYTIYLQGGQDNNYEFVLVNGTLTIVVPQGIEEILATEQNAEIYTLDGRRVNAPQKGINIIKTSNGKTRKVFVK